MKIYSPIPHGNGAHVVHKLLSDHLHNYTLLSYNPYWTFFPLIIPFLFRNINKLGTVHSTPDHGYLFRKKDQNLVITFHNYVLDSYMNPFSSLLQIFHYQTDLRYFTRKALGRATIVTAVSHFTKNLVKNDLNYPGTIQVIYNGIDTERFFPTPSFSDTRKEFKVLFSGNLIRRKGVDLLPLIANRLPRNIKILYTSGLRTRHSLPDHPQLINVGSIPYADMPKVYQNVDLLLFPTVREGFGLAAAEAMACGLPVVATNCSSLPELIVNGKGGFLCSLGNVESFAEAIVTLAESPSRRQEMGQFNRERAEKLFSLKRMIHEYTQLFDQLAK